MSRLLKLPKSIYRNSLAIYYLTELNHADVRQRTHYALREDQKK